MKGKKCIGLLILCITCLLSLNLSLNANAITKTNLITRKFTTIDYTTTNPTGTITGQTLKNKTFSPSVYVNIPDNSVFNIENFKLAYESSVDITKNKNYDLEINIIAGYVNYAGTGYQLSPIPQAMCPQGSSNFVIDDCNISIEEIDSSVIELYTQGQITIPNSTNLLAKSYSFNRWVIKMKGHWKGNDTTINNFITKGQIFSVYNPGITTLQNYDFIYVFSLPTIVFYDEQESATEQEQQKELEDRDNLETQSTSTDNQANNAGQSAENTGTTLFGAFTQFVSALSNVNGSSCVLPNMQIYSLDLGQMDLCTYDIPPQIMALVSIGMVFIIVPLGIHLVKKMLNLYKEITG